MASTTGPAGGRRRRARLSGPGPALSRGRHHAGPSRAPLRGDRGPGVLRRHRVAGRARLAARELPQRRAIPTQLAECPTRLLSLERTAFQSPVGPEWLHDFIEVVGQAKNAARRQEGPALLEVA